MSDQTPDRRSRPIALLGIPLELGAGEPGCVMGPAALRTAGLPGMLRDLDYEVIDHGDLARPTDIALDLAPGDAARCKHPAEIAAWTRAIHDRAYDMAGAAALPVFLGGDHSISMGTISAIARRCQAGERRLVVLWLDAHADFNTPATSPTGNMHGMPVAFLTGEPSLRPLLGDRSFVPLEPADFHLFGLRSIDVAERRALHASGVNSIDMRLIDEFGVSVLLKRLLDRVAQAGAHLHVSLDLDFLDPSLAPGVGTSVPGGATYREAHLIMEMLHESGLVGSIDLVELNPFLDERGRSARALAELAASLFGRTVLDRPARPRGQEMAK
ncbi:MAG: arginase [Aliidongia sp.]